MLFSFSLTHCVVDFPLHFADTKNLLISSTNFQVVFISVDAVIQLEVSSIRGQNLNSFKLQ